MTQIEKTGIRELNFSKWIRESLPDSKTGFMVSDIDFIIYNYKTKNIAIIELKTRSAELKTWQSIFYKNICKWIKNGIDDDWNFKGFYFIKFENTFFNDGKCFLNNIEISELDLIKELSFVNEN